MTETTPRFVKYDTARGEFTYAAEFDNAKEACEFCAYKDNGKVERINSGLFRATFTSPFFIDGAE